MLVGVLRCLTAECVDVRTGIDVDFFFLKDMCYDLQMYLAAH